MLTRTPRGDDSQSGFSLIELLVVVVLMSVIGGIVATSVIQSLKASRTAQARVIALNDLTVGMERISRELRVADPLDLSQVADFSEVGNEIGVFIGRNDRVFNYQYYLATNAEGVPELWEDVTVWDLAGNELAAEAGSRRFIVGTENVNVGIPLIEYIDELGILLDCTGQATIEDCRQYLASNTAQVRLTLVKSLPEQQPITVETVVSVRYTRFN